MRPLDRTHRGSDGRGDPLQLTGVAAGGHHHGPAGLPATAPQAHRGDPPAIDLHPGGLVVDEPDPETAAPADEGADQSSVVDPVVLGQLDAAPDGWRQHRHEGPALPGREPAGIEPQPDLEVEHVVTGLAIRRVHRHQQAALGHVVDGLAGGRLEPSGELRPRS